LAGIGADMDGQEDKNTGIRNMLATPPLHLSVHDSLPFWTWVDIHVRCVRPKGFTEGPWFTGAVRGAWGRQLYAHQNIEQERNESFRRPTAYDVFFSSMGHLISRAEIPRPFIIQADYGVDFVDITLRLFGHALYWRQIAQETFLAALKDGISIAERGAVRASFPVFEASWTQYQGAIDLSNRCNSKSYHIYLLTPLDIHGRGQIKGHLKDFVMSTALRIAGMARWQGIELDQDWKYIRRLSNETIIEDIEMKPVKWTRYSLRQPGASIPVIGLTGTFILKHIPSVLEDFLALARLAHTGARCSFGLGRIQVELCS
jgi:hypothetical protein